MKKLALVILVLGALYFLGPVEKFDGFEISPIENNSITINNIEEHIRLREASLPLKRDNQSIIKWAKGSKIKTPYVLLYLHGFSASPMCGSPTMQIIAERYGMNLYAPRLYEHGLDEDLPMKEFTPLKIVNSVRQALLEAKTLGDSIVLMSSSTGGTLSIIIGPEEPRVSSYIMYSPNIDMYDKMSSLLVKPWGKQLLKLSIGDAMIHKYTTIDQQQYWYQQYHSNAVLGLTHLVKKNMHAENFNKIDKPLFLGLFYKDDEIHDKVISIKSAEQFFKEISTPQFFKELEYFPDALDHGIENKYFSKDYESVITQTDQFIKEKLNIDKAK